MKAKTCARGGRLGRTLGRLLLLLLLLVLLLLLLLLLLLSLGLCDVPREVMVLLMLLRLPLGDEGVADGVAGTGIGVGVGVGVGVGRGGGGSGGGDASSSSFQQLILLGLKGSHQTPHLLRRQLQGLCKRLDHATRGFEDLMDLLLALCDFRVDGVQLRFLCGCDVCMERSWRSG